MAFALETKNFARASHKYKKCIGQWDEHALSCSNEQGLLKTSDHYMFKCSDVTLYTQTSSWLLRYYSKSYMRPSHRETGPYKEPKKLNCCNFRENINETEKVTNSFGFWASLF